MATVEKILIIDDDRFIRQTLRAFLEDLGLAVLEAADGPEGLAAVVQERPALALLDLSMPGMSGFEVIERLKALPEAESMPVIVITGLDGAADRQRAFTSGAVDYLVKPLSLDDVNLRVRTHLGLRRQELDLRTSRDELRRALHDASAMNRNQVALNEKLRRSEEVKTRFLASMRNEINNPLGDIMNLADRITDPAVPPELARSLAERIRQEAFHLDRQLQDVFSAAELEAGQADPFFAKVDVASVALDLVASFAPAAKARGIELVLVAEGDLAGFPTDGEKVHHILANLVAFALQCAAPPGRVELHAAGGQQLTLTVVDQGPGLSAEELRSVFDPFSTHEDARQGQRLGLPVAKALVDLLEGDLQVESAPGRGSLFRVTLPRAEHLEAGAEGLAGNILIFDEPQEF